jgi:hypothetical protein
MAKGSAPPARKTVVMDGITYYAANQHIQYCASSHRQVRPGALIDRDANGGIAGDDVQIINHTGQQVDVQGIDNHQIVDIPIVTAGAVVKTQRGEVVIILHQYAYTGKGKTIHASGQLEWYKQQVDDRSIKVGGKQQIKTLDGYFILLDIKGFFSHARLSRTFGCTLRMESMSILRSLLMIWQLLWLNHRNLLMSWSRSTSLSSRER